MPSDHLSCRIPSLGLFGECAAGEKLETSSTGGFVGVSDLRILQGSTRRDAC